MPPHDPGIWAGKRVPFAGDGFTDTCRGHHQNCISNRDGEDRELRHLHVEQAFIRAGVDKELRMEPPIDY